MKRFNEFITNTEYAIKAYGMTKEEDKIMGDYYNPTFLERSHLFEVEKNLSNALLLTKNQKRFFNQPFSNVTIMPNEFSIGDKKIIFINVRTAIFFKDNESIIGLDKEENYLKFMDILKSASEFGEEENTFFVPKEFADTFSFRNIVLENGKFKVRFGNTIWIFYGNSKGYGVSSYSITDKIFDAGFNKKECEILNRYISNFFDFLNNPEVEIKTISPNTERNIERAQNNRIKFPFRNYIKIKGKLFVYLNNFRKQIEKNGYSHRFWIRGHFRRFYSNRYIHKKGETIWILPYTKGEGILVQKVYKAEKEKVHENQES